MEQNFLTYKGRPLVRSGDVIYYGSMGDAYVVMMQIRSKKMQDEQEVADLILLQLLATDGMLVKRPILVTPKTVLVGFNENEWAAAAK